MRPIDPQAGKSAKANAGLQESEPKRQHILMRHIDFALYALVLIGTVVLSFGGLIESSYILVSGVIIILMLPIHLYYRHKVRQRRKPNYSVLTSLILCALMSLGYGTYEHFAMPLQPSFQASVDITINDVGRANRPSAYTFFMAVTANPQLEYISPVDLMLWIRLINMQTVTATIDRYEVDASHGLNGPWYELVPISNIGRNRRVYLVGKTPEAALLMDSSVFLDVALESRALQPRDNVTGWVAFECPRGHIPCSEDYYRMSVRDTSGILGSVIIGPATGHVNPGEEYLHAGVLKPNRQALRLDIRKLPMRLMPGSEVLRP
jgi:hypothetical protein